MVWCSVLWCGVVLHGMVWCGAVWCGVLFVVCCIICGMLWCGVLWCGVLRCGVVCGVVLSSFGFSLRLAFSIFVCRHGVQNISTRGLTYYYVRTHIR